MTADPSRVADALPGWYVVTNQGVFLSPRHDTFAQAGLACADIVRNLRRELIGEGQTDEYLDERLRAIRVDYGRMSGAWGGFAPESPPAP